MSITLALSARRDAFHAWRAHASAIKTIALALALAGFTGLCAQIRLPVPGTPVPITAQTFAVLLSGFVAGRRGAALSQILYVALGAAGLPWFADHLSGIAVLFGPTGGYLIGFIFAAAFLGWAADARKDLRSIFGTAGLMWFSSLILIQVPGLAGLALWHHIVLGTDPALSELIAMGMAPFVVGDAIKTMAAASFARAVAPR